MEQRYSFSVKPSLILSLIMSVLYFYSKAKNYLTMVS